MDINPDRDVTESGGSVTTLGNLGTGGSSYDLDTVIGTGANLKLHPSGSCLFYGVSGDFASTPDTAANSITGDMTLIAYIQPDDWTPSSFKTIISKWESTGNNRAYLFRLDGSSSGKLILTRSSDGTAGSALSKESTVPTGFTDGTGHWVRVTWDVNDDADITFYTSDDPEETSLADISWSQLGGVRSFPTGSADTDALLTMGAFGDDGSGNPFLGSIYRAVGIASTDPTDTPVFDFDPREYSTGTTFSSGGATWTLNGDTYIQNTGHDVVMSSGSAGLETSSSQTISQPSVIVAVARYTASLTSDQYLFDTVGAAGDRNVIWADDPSDRFAAFAGSTIALSSSSYDTDAHVFTFEVNGSSSKITVSGIGSDSGDAGSEAWDFGIIMADKDNSNAMVGWIGRLLVFDSSLTSDEVALIQNRLADLYNV